MASLHKEGVYEVVQPDFEASLELTRQALLHLNIPLKQINDFTDVVHKELYAPLYSSEEYYRIISQLKTASRSMDLNWEGIPADSPLVGKSIRELNIRNATGVSIVAIIRDEDFIPNPEPDFVFLQTDIVGVIGEFGQVKQFREYVSADES